MAQHPVRYQPIDGLMSRFRLLRTLVTEKPSRFRSFRAFATKKTATGQPAFDFDELARDLASGLTRRQALRRFAVGVAAGVLAEFTDLLYGAAFSPTAAQPTLPTGTCSSDRVNACVNQIQPQLATALMSCSAPPPGPLVSAVLPPWLQQADLLHCLDTVGGMAAQDLQMCLGIGCPPGSVCGSNVCCPQGLVGCGGQCCTDCCGNACCSDGQSCCFGACTDTQSDPGNCGGCGQVCASGTCVGGVCSGGASNHGNGQGNGGSNNFSGGGSGLGQVYPTMGECQAACASGCCLEQDTSPYFPVFACLSGTDFSTCGSGGQMCKPCGLGEQQCINQTCCLPSDISKLRCCPSQHICTILGRIQYCCEGGCCAADGCHYQYGSAESNARSCGTPGGVCHDCIKEMGAGSTCVSGHCQPPSPANCLATCFAKQFADGSTGGCCDSQGVCHPINDQFCTNGTLLCFDCTKPPYGPGYKCLDAYGFPGCYVPDPDSPTRPCPDQAKCPSPDGSVVCCKDGCCDYNGQTGCRRTDYLTNSQACGSPGHPCFNCTLDGLRCVGGFCR